MPTGYIHRGWQPLREVQPEEINPKLAEVRGALGVEPPDEVWINNRYQVVVDFVESSDDRHDDRDIPKEQKLAHLSIHSHDRGPMRNWRHLQQIKNEVCGEERFGVEVFPAESLLVDTSNEYHLFVLPEGETMGFGLDESLVSSDEQVESYNAAPHPGHQEPWEPGLTTGRNKNANVGPEILDAPLGTLGRVHGG